jgi:preprotein translocase subunit YajC
MKILDANLLRNLLTVLILLAFVIPLSYVSVRRKQRKKKDPVKEVGFMINVLYIVVCFNLLICIFDDQKDSMFLQSILFLGISMVFVNSAFKHQQERIKALEEKLNDRASQPLPSPPT